MIETSNQQNFIGEQITTDVADVGHSILQDGSDGPLFYLDGNSKEVR